MNKHDKVDFQLAARSLSYAKIRVKSLTAKFFGQKRGWSRKLPTSRVI